MKDLTNYINIDNLQNPKIVYEYAVRLDEKTMIELLSAKAIFIDGNYFNVPEQQILKCLIMQEYGETILQLELIKK